jgi:membrane-associated phospholipid phosphatase
VFLWLLAGYAALTVAILLKTPVLAVDAGVVHLNLRHRFADLYPWLHTYVMLGQRGPTTLAALPWFVWLAWRRRSTAPLVTLGLALVVLNASVGIVKIAVGRAGPRYGGPVDAIFHGGDIYPSGHVANAVVLYGVIAMLVAPRFRTAAIIGGSLITVTVGIATFFLNTHWVTDVVGGLLAGGLVLCSLRWLLPPTQRVADRAIAWLRTRGAVSASEAVADAGELLGGVPQRGGGVLVARRSRRTDSVRVTDLLHEPVRAVESAAGDVRHRRSEQARQGTHLRRLGEQAVAERHHLVLDRLGLRLQLRRGVAGVGGERA